MLLDISNKIGTDYLHILQDIKRISDNKGYVFFIVGATARDFIYEYYYNVHAPRATRDLDLAVEVESWDKFDSLKQELLETGKYEETDQVQRLIHNGVFVDIVPFGLIADREKNIKWSPEHEIIMSVAGFDEAYQNSLNLMINKEPELIVKVASIPGLAIMKLISWNERGYERGQDADDFLFIIENYQYAGNFDRIFGESHLLEEEGFDHQYAAIRLLGRDMAKISEPKTIERIKNILTEETGESSEYGMISYLNRGEDRFDELLRKISVLKIGFYEIHQT